MKVLIIGFGSIGQRHNEVLSKFKDISTIDIVTKQTLNDNITSFQSLQDIKQLDIYDYYIIASPTNKHYEQLKYLDLNVSNKIIFCEKPLFERNQNLKIKNNKVFVGYVLRFHPLLQKLKKLLKDELAISVNINCGSYLPTWRSNIKYQDSYSAKKDEGGGVLLDLSHELDYLQWLFGTISDIRSYQSKVSDLEIDSDDLVVAIGKTTKNTVFNLSIDYINKISHRDVLINTNNSSYKLDFINNTLLKHDKSGKEIKDEYKNLERNYMFEQMHKSILTNQKIACTYDEAKQVMNTIGLIQEQNI